MESSLWVVSMAPWSGATCAVLNLPNHRHHLLQNFPFPDEESEVQRWWGTCSIYRVLA